MPLFLNNKTAGPNIDGRLLPDMKLDILIGKVVSRKIFPDRRQDDFFPWE
jgi:hypothetical protein